MLLSAYLWSNAGQHPSLKCFKATEASAVLKTGVFLVTLLLSQSLQAEGGQGQRRGAQALTDMSPARPITLLRRCEAHGFCKLTVDRSHVWFHFPTRWLGMHTNIPARCHTRGLCHNQDPPDHLRCLKKTGLTSHLAPQPTNPISCTTAPCSFSSCLCTDDIILTSKGTQLSLDGPFEHASSEAINQTLFHLRANVGSMLQDANTTEKPPVAFDELLSDQYHHKYGDIIPCHVLLTGIPHSYESGDVHLLIGGMARSCMDGSALPAGACHLPDQVAVAQYFGEGLAKAATATKAGFSYPITPATAIDPTLAVRKHEYQKKYSCWTMELPIHTSDVPAFCRGYQAAFDKCPIIHTDGKLAVGVPSVKIAELKRQACDCMTEYHVQHATYLTDVTVYLFMQLCTRIVSIYRHKHQYSMRRHAYMILTYQPTCQYPMRLHACPLLMCQPSHQVSLQPHASISSTFSLKSSVQVINHSSLTPTSLIRCRGLTMMVDNYGTSLASPMHMYTHAIMMTITILFITSQGALKHAIKSALTSNSYRVPSMSDTACMYMCVNLTGLICMTLMYIVPYIGYCWTRLSVDTRHQICMCGAHTTICVPLLLAMYMLHSLTKQLIDCMYYATRNFKHAGNASMRWGTAIGALHLAVMLSLLAPPLLTLLCFVKSTDTPRARSTVGNVRLIIPAMPSAMQVTNLPGKVVYHLKHTIFSNGAMRHAIQHARKRSVRYVAQQYNASLTIIYTLKRNQYRPAALCLTYPIDHQTKHNYGSSEPGCMHTKEMHPSMQCGAGRKYSDIVRNHAEAPTNMYFERQDRNMCMVHSFNNLLGTNALHGASIIDMCNEISKTCPEIRNHYDHSGRSGNFTYTPINLFLHAHGIPWFIKRGNNHLPPYAPVARHPDDTVAQYNQQYNRTPDIVHGSSKAQIMERIPVQCMNTGFILHHKTGHFWHAVAIRLHQGKWYLLESMASAPVPLQAEVDWHQLHGDIYTPYQGDCVSALQVNAEMALACKRYHDPLTQGSLISALLSSPGQHDAHPANTRNMPLPECMPAPTVVQTRPTHTTTSQHETVEMQSSNHAMRRKVARKTITHKGPMDAFLTRVPPPLVLSEDAPCAPPVVANVLQRAPMNSKRPQFQQTLDQLLVPSDQPNPTKDTCNTTTPTNTHGSVPRENAGRICIMTLNCRGIRTSWETLRLALATHAPDIVFMTETKLISGMQLINTMRREEPRYTFHASSITKAAANQGTPSPARVTRQGAAGVIVAIHNKYAQSNCMEKREVIPNMAGFVAHVTLRTPSSVPVHIIGTYMPSTPTNGQHISALRESIYKHLQGITAACTKDGHQLIIGGDMNAALTTQDRSTGVLTTVDKAYARFCKQARLSPLAPAAGRPHSFHYQEAVGATTQSSRIDDVLLLQHANTPVCRGSSMASEQCETLGGTLDHELLLHSAPHNILSLNPAPESDQTAPVDAPHLIMPIKKEHLLQLQAVVQAKLDPAFQTAGREVTTALNIALAALNNDYSPESIQKARNIMKSSPACNVDTLADGIMRQLEAALCIMHEVCPSKPPSTKHCLPRTVARAYEHLHAKSRALKMLSRAYNQQSKEEDMDATDLKHNLATMFAGNPLVTSLIQDISNEPLDLTKWQESLTTQASHTHDAMRHIRSEKNKEQAKAARSAFQKKLATQPRATHRSIWNQGTEDSAHTGPATALRDPYTSTVHTSHDDILRIFSTNLAGLMSPTGMVKTGQYLPDQRDAVAGDYPWARPDAIDRFTIFAPAKECQKTAQPLCHLMERCAYDACLKHLGRNKQPGPDGIPNELLQWLPVEWHTHIHSLFILMWIMGRTPTSWKTSNTSMLYKKSDPMHAPNYRPIGLASAVYKLWTANVTLVSAGYAEGTQIFSTTQEGFRAFRNTQRQLSNLVNVINDAALTQQDLFIMYVDFTSAFNMVDHDRLLCIMYDLGFTIDIIDTVKDLYTDAVTQVTHKGRIGEPIPITRGTIQGDVLSPFLFLIFIEPLIRWLHVGGRGYNYGCLTKEVNKQHNASSGTYADDLGAMTHTTENMQTQATKIEQYGDWSGVQVNSKKCRVTGILHKTSSSNPCNPNRLHKLLHGRIRVGCSLIPYLPPTEPYPYLGIPVSLVLDWSPQITAAVKLVQDKGTLLSQSMASPRQCLHVIATCIKPAVAYAFAVAPYSTFDISRLDRAIAVAVRKCCKLPKSFQNAAIHLSHTHAGMGVGSLMVEYVQVTTACLTRALNDTGRLGLVTRALMDLQHKQLSNLPPDQLPARATKHYTILRQIALMRKAGIELSDGSNGIITAPEHGLWRMHRLASCMDQLGMDPIDDGHSQHVTPGMMYPLHELGIRDHTQLIDVSGTHLITSTDLQCQVGKRVERRHMIALNRVSLAISQHAAPAHKGKAYSDTAPLPAACRALPPGLVRVGPPSPNLGGIHDITQYTTPMQMNTTPQRHVGSTGIKITCGVRKPKLTHTQLHEQQRLAYGRQCITWAATAELDFALANQGSEEDIWNARLACCSPKVRKGSFFTSHNLPAHCTWEAFRTAVMAPPMDGQAPLPAEILHLLYSQQDEIDYFTSFQTTKGAGRLYMVQWKPTTIQAAHLTAYQALKYECTSFRHVEGAGHTIEVNWAPSLETEESLTAMLGAERMVTMQADMHARNQPKAPGSRQAPPPADEHLNNAQKQGCWAQLGDPGVGYESSHVKLIRDHVHIDPTPRNPDSDILPPHRYTIQLGVRPLGYTESLDPNTAYIYSPAGRCIGHIGVPTLCKLHAEYLRKQVENPEVHTTHKTTTFPEDIARLLLRYSNKSKSTKHHGTTPDDMMHAISKLGVTQERFASPLDRSAHLPVYYSACPEDEVFGAAADAYASVWSEASHANPIYDDQIMDRAVRWALASACVCAKQSNPIPSCTVFVLPKWATSPYTTHLNHPNVYMLDSVPRHHVRFQDPAHWETGKGPMLCNNPKWDVVVFAVANAAGYTNILKPNFPAFATAWQTVRSAWSNKTLVLPNQHHEHVTTVHPPRALRKILESPTALGITPANSIYTTPTVPTAHATLETAFPCVQSLANDPDSAVYTDGSCIKDNNGGPNLVGAAIFVSGRSVTAERTYMVNPGGKAYTHTINRAELSAIHMALGDEVTPVNKNITIYTDSLCSIQYIHKMLRAPGRLMECKHKDLINNIVVALSARAMAGAHTYIYKVTSHKFNIRGNEKADAAARLSAMQPHENTITDTTPCNPYDHMVWPVGKPHAAYMQHATTPDTKEDPPRPCFVSNLTRGVKQITRTWCQTGDASMDGVYAQAWKGTAPHLHKSSAAMWSDQSITWPQLLNVLKGRWGHLWSMKLAHRYRTSYMHNKHIATNDNCPLCGLSDGGGHMLGGCQHKICHSQYIKRHDEAVKIIQKAISSGALGGSFCIMDAGKKENLPPDVSSKRLPGWLSAPSLGTEAFEKCRPDILLIPGLSQQEVARQSHEELAAGRYTIHIIEVGYCSDTKHAEKAREKDAQHKTLVDALLAAGHRVMNHVVTLGHCGTTLVNTQNLLRQLEITHEKSQQTLAALTRHAVHSAHNIILTRRSLERQKPTG